MKKPSSYEGLTKSNYKPPKPVADLTMTVTEDYETGLEILTTPYVELNDLDVLERDARDSRTFNAFVDENVEDPNEAWKWRGTRSKARNKAITMHAHVTAGYTVPMFMAQNENSEEDREFSSVMRDVIEWLVYNSEYRTSYMGITLGMLVHPVTFLGAEWCEIYQTIKERTEDGKITTKEVLDEILSGFHAPIYTCDQVLITNAYEQNIQKQRAIIIRQWKDYQEMEAKWGEHENWLYVQPGVSTVFNDKDGMFYEVTDNEHEGMVEEVIWKNRREDLEVPFLGGIYMGDSNVEANPIKHRDNRNSPKYNVIPFGYQRINEHFFYYKSLMNVQFYDNQLLDAQYEIGMNRAFLDANMPIAVSGTDKVDGEIVFPGSVASFADKETRITPLLPQANLNGLFNAMSLTERSMDESSTSDTTGGQTPGGDVKATGIVIAERNAKILLQGVGKSIAESITQYGSLMADIAIQHLTVPQVDQIVGDQSRMKYRSFVIKNKSVGGKNVSKVIRFDESLLGTKLSEEEKKSREMKMLTDIGYPEHKSHLYVVNPEVFSRLKYLCYVEPETMFAKNEEFYQAMMTQLLTTFANNPYISLEALTRKTAYAFFKGEAEDLMQKQPQALPSPTETPKTQAGAEAVSKGIGSGMGRGIGGLA
jgi:hypothetical protein